MGDEVAATGDDDEGEEDEEVAEAASRELADLTSEAADCTRPI